MQTATTRLYQPALYPQINRREFLKIAGTLGAAAALTPLMAACAPADRPSPSDGAAAPAAAKAALIPDAYRPLIAAAILAPSGHNTQPWKFSVQGQTLRIFPDKNRSLAVVDPEDRELYISLGCALENLLVAAAHAGFAGEPIYFPPGQPECIQVELSAAPASSDPLFDAIRSRQSTRDRYDGKPVPNSVLNQLGVLSPEREINTQLFTSAASIEPLVEWVMAGDRSQYADPAFIAELTAWVRFNDGEAAKYGDGLSTKCTGNPSVPRWLGKAVMKVSSADSYAKKDEKMMRSSSGMALFIAEKDDTAGWIDTG
ncbi:MAG TPA: twin-arginine translocation signal domain-containing protein, partial [Anaerolineales bacterium]